MANFISRMHQAANPLLAAGAATLGGPAMAQPPMQAPLMPTPPIVSQAPAANPADLLMRMGLGIMGASRPGASFSEAVGAGGLTGLQSYDYARQQAEQAQLMRQRLQMEQMRMLQDAEDRRRQRALQAQRLTQPDLSKSPTYIRHPGTGQLQIIQLSASGEPTTVELPEGYEPVRPVTIQDVGSHLAVFPQGSTTPVAAIPKSLPPEATPATRAAQAAAVERAKTREQAIAALPEAEASAEYTIENINDLLEHPGLASATGAGSLLWSMPGSEKRDFEIRLEQLKGRAFQQAVESMRGTGSLSEAEGQAATAAIARMDAAQSTQAFKDALIEFRDIIEKGRKRARKGAGVEDQDVPPPPPGFIEDTP